MAKYDPLRDYLLAHPGRVTLSFDAIAEMVGGLPASADDWAPIWWADDPTHVQAHAWLDIGRSVAAVDPAARTVTFGRAPASTGTNRELPEVRERVPDSIAVAPAAATDPDALIDPVLAGDSAEQRAAESVMLDALSGELGVPLAKRRLGGGARAWVEIDGVADDPPILVEAWAHQGPPKAAQQAKVLKDAFKLVWAAEAFRPGARKILLFSDADAARPFVATSRSWAAAALAHFGVEVRVVELPAQHRQAVRQAQARQYR